MTQFLLIQYRTDKSRRHEQNCIREKLSLHPSQLETVNALHPETLPQKEKLQKYAGIIIGASGQYNVSDMNGAAKKCIEQTYPLLETIIEKDIPMLALCFGHQLLAHLLGSKVKQNPEMAETSAQEIVLTEAGSSSPLYKHMPLSFYAALGHKESVIELPPGTTLLASSERCPIQSYQIKNNIFTTQFHPELDKEDILWRLQLYPEYRFGRTMDKISEDTVQTPHTAGIWLNFRKIARTHQNPTQNL